jgi:ferrous iron transport protein B
VLSPVLKGILGLPPSAVAALMTGFLRKEIAVGMLAPLGLSVRQLVVASVVLTVYVPCIASLVVLFREFGLKDTAKVLATMIVASLAAGGLLNWIL